MRCKFCGSKAIYPYKNHEQAGAGRVIAGAMIAGTVGAIAGLAGKNVKGYRCSACGMFSEQPMEFTEELSVDSAIRDAKNGKTVIYERYQEKYANIEFVPVRQAVKQESVQLLDEDYDEDDEDIELLPEAEPVDESIKRSYCPNQYIVGSPVFISNVTIKDDNGTDALWLDVNNISSKTLRSVYLNITVYDDVGDQISTSTFAFQGLSAATGEQLPQAKPFNLNTNVAYKVDVTCEKAAFTDDSIWRKEENPTIYSVPEKTELVPESFAQYKYLQVLLAKKGALRVGQKLYYPVVEETHRLCVCGNPAVNGSKCTACGLDEADLQEVMDYDILIQCRKDVIVKTAKERTEALRALKETFLEEAYQEACNLLNGKTSADCLKAAKAFAAIGDYKNARELITESRQKAENLARQEAYNRGKALVAKPNVCKEDFESAITEFRKATGWNDADTQIAICQQQIEELKIKAEEKRKEREKEAEIARAEAAAQAKRNKIIAIIVGAVVCVTIAVLIIFNTIIIPESKYNDAIALMEAGKYAEAISVFEALGGHKDSAAKIAECNTIILESKYTDAIALMDNGKYNTAVSAFEALDGYKDSLAKIAECKTLILDGKYNDALALMEAGHYTSAVSAFKALNGYKDSIAMIAECQKKDFIAECGQAAYDKWGIFTVGDYLTFGKYEQDNNHSNGPEDIEWLILDINDGKVLVVSKDALDYQPYHASRTAITWENCTLRKWLNSTFVKNAFTAAEKAAISTVTVTADENPKYSTNPGSATQDKVFLLSVTEAKYYFKTNDARRCNATAFVKAQGLITYWSWFLRTPGNSEESAAQVNSGGDIPDYGHYVDADAAIRPAMWIDLSKVS